MLACRLVKKDINKDMFLKLTDFLKTVIHCVRSVRIRSFSGPHFSTNAGKCEPKQLQIRTLFTQSLSQGRSNDRLWNYFSESQSILQSYLVLPCANSVIRILTNSVIQIVTKV